MRDAAGEYRSAALLDIPYSGSTARMWAASAG